MSGPSQSKSVRRRAYSHNPGFNVAFRLKGKRRVKAGYRVFWYEGGVRERKLVKTKEQAEALVKEKLTQQELRSQGLQTITTPLHPTQVRVAEKAFRILDENDWLDLNDSATADRLTDAVGWFVEHYAPPPTAPAVEAFVPVFLEDRSDLEKRSIDDYRSTLKLFVEDGFGELKLNEVTPKHIRTFMDGRNVSKTTKSKYYSALRAFFNFAATKREGVQLIVENPVLELRKPKSESPRRIIYSLAEVKDLIQISIVLGCAPHVVLRLFTMLRDEETSLFFRKTRTVRANGKERETEWDCWNDINLETGSIRFHDDSAPKYSREITIMPALGRWLRLFKDRKVPMRYSRLEARAREIAVPKKFGAKFDNLIRHTAVSNRVVQTDSKITTSVEAGTSEGVITKHYFRRVTKSDAAAFFELGPEHFDTEMVNDRIRQRDLTHARRFYRKYPRLKRFHEKK